MVFSSIEFLFLFLPLVVVAYCVVPGAFQNVVLLFVSLLFYTWSSGAMVCILIVSIFVDYGAALLVAWGRQAGRSGYRSLGLFLSVAVNLALLGYFKYANFIVAELNTLGQQLGLGMIAWPSVVLPIGISFFTFQSMSYTLDVARGRCEPLHNPIDFALYVALFPQLIAGPIVRYHEIAAQLRNRRVQVSAFAEGVVRFSHGLAKKVIIADTLGAFSDAAFSVPAMELSTGCAWLGVVAFHLQIYFDFSGYSDMALGLGQMLGFRFPENFRRPYSAISLTDAWQRWHITLTNWFRDYVFFPLTFRNRKARGRPALRLYAYFNILLLYLLVGFWHGANWTFLLFGAYHGTLLIAENILGQDVTRDARYIPLRRAVTAFLVLLAWPLFRGESLTQAWSFYQAMFSFSGVSLAPAVINVLTTRGVVTLGVASASVLLPRWFVGGIVVSAGTGVGPALGRFAVMAVALPYALMLVVSETFKPFLYFQF